MNGIGRPQPGGMPGQQPGMGGGGQPPPHMGSANWLQKHPNGPLAQGRLGTEPGDSSWLDQFNAFQDPNIGGEQPGPLSQGWGGFGQGQTNGGADGTGSGSMMATKMNDWLNTFSTGGQREQAMNGIGYNNGGNPYVPQQGRTPNQGWMNSMMENVAPDSTWQMQSPGASADNLSSFGGYEGVITGGQGQQSAYQSFAPQGQTRPSRRTRTFGQVMQ
jgi:hypothetical protein